DPHGLVGHQQPVRAAGGDAELAAHADALLRVPPEELRGVGHLRPRVGERLAVLERDQPGEVLAPLRHELEGPQEDAGPVPRGGRSPRGRGVGGGVHRRPRVVEVGVGDRREDVPRRGVADLDPPVAAGGTPSSAHEEVGGHVDRVEEGAHCVVEDAHRTPAVVAGACGRTSSRSAARSPECAERTMRSSASTSSGRGLFATSRWAWSACSAVHRSRSAGNPISARVEGMPTDASSAAVRSIASSARASGGAPGSAPSATATAASSGTRTGRLYSITYGSSAPTPTPCGVWVSAPTGYWSACAAAVPALPSAKPPAVAPSIIASRASRSSGTSTARRRWCAMRRIPRSAYMSVSSFLPTKTRSVPSSAVAGRRTAVNDSIACDNASAPALAVSAGGQPSVSSGSHTAVCGTRCGLEMPTLLTRSGSVSTATGVTSEPVPAVVGSATTGSTGPGTRSSP